MNDLESPFVFSKFTFAAFQSACYGMAQRTGGVCLEATSGFVEFVSSACLQGALILNACLKRPIVIIEDPPDLVVAKS